MVKLRNIIDPLVALDGFRQFVEDDVNSLTPKKDDKGAKDDYLGALDHELGYDWKRGVLHDKIVVMEPVEVGHFVYKTSAWKVLNANDDFVTIQLDPASAPNLAINVFRKRPDGKLERLDPNSPFDTEPKTIPREKFSKILDAALRSAAQTGGMGAAPGGAAPGGGAAPPGPPGAM